MRVKPTTKTRTPKPTEPPDLVGGVEVSAAVVKPRSKRRTKTAKFGVGSVVKHRFYPFRGVVFDIDPVFDNTEEWWLSIPAELRPKKNQPFYHLLAENDETEYIAYVSEQNLVSDRSGEPLRHPRIGELFVLGDDGNFRPVFFQAH